MKLFKTIAVVGSREFKNYAQLSREIDNVIESTDDEITSGGAIGADSMAQRYAKENGYNIKIFYPKYARYGRGATFIRNELIVRDADIVLAFYQKGRFQQGGTANSAEWARKHNVPLFEYEEE
jgi:predicted Rossmann fold nucleotide-binding protein DprA/Smf involved in DNA uptake